MSDNPFLEPDDGERTVVRPVPGGRRAPAAQPLGNAPLPEPTAAGAPAAPIGEGVETLAMGVNPLVAAAAPLLQLLARLPNTIHHPDPGELRERAVRAIHSFEQRTRDLGLPRELLPPAHYALCASIDDVVLNTPWGSTGVWDANSLVSIFHREVRSGERFFQLLGQMRQNPGLYLPVIELMYLCMSLGLQGQYRLSPRGPAELDRLREETYAVIVRQRQAPEPDLSPHWKGLLAPYRGSRPTLPVWVAASVGLAVLAALFVWLSSSLNAASDDLFARLLTAPPAQMPQIARVAPVKPVPPAPLPEPAAVDNLCAFLQPEVDQGLISIICKPPNPVIRINNRGMFASGSATIDPRFVPLLNRIGDGLKNEPGAVEVIGYTDNRPIHTVQFPSNFQLSAARAQAARALIGRALGDPSRIAAEGRGEADPLNGNATPAEREENRRIEIVLHRPG
ncbi:MAG TPA: type IVB secretion system protein IcmH/DotU [Stellaceae bacterium]|jgi:type VI secretion system protein ImpK|nr:type IVB secretion system protein IcmH/DotU [Stellaceae bacterium]